MIMAVLISRTDQRDPITPGTPACLNALGNETTSSGSFVPGTTPVSQAERTARRALLRCKPKNSSRVRLPSANFKRELSASCQPSYAMGRDVRNPGNFNGLDDSIFPSLTPQEMSALSLEMIQHCLHFRFANVECRLDFPPPAGYQLAGALASVVEGLGAWGIGKGEVVQSKASACRGRRPSRPVG